MPTKANLSEEEIEAIASASMDTKPEPVSDWYPDLNPTQEKIFNDPSKYVLGYGEKGSGKTIGFAHKLTRHAYEENNALVLILAPSIRTGAEGIWHDLDTLVLPQWEEGIGLEYTSSKLDPNTKDRHRWIRNRFGGWSKLLLVSIPYAGAVETRIKGPAPSHCYVDELTQCDGVEYFRYPAAQLGRRRGIEGPQQYCASCNPEGPSHWVYKQFFEDCINEDGKRNKDFKVYHVPMKENSRRLPPGYVESLESILRSDPVEWRRLIEGEWVDRPSGEALFKEYFAPSMHIKGDELTGKGLMPKAGHPIIIGYDLGQVYSAVTFLQMIPTERGNLWIAFDEVDYLGERHLYKRLCQQIMQKMDYWNQKIDTEFYYEHITDSSAINQWHPGGEGSYDSWDFERYSDGRIRMVGCPKGQGSVEARVRLLSGKLFQDEFYASALCTNTVEMLMNLESDKKDPTKPKRSKYIHKFDSITYPMFKLDLNNNSRLPKATDVRPHLIHCGIP